MRKPRESNGDREVMSPRMELAASLYGSGVARTKKEAAEMAGLKSGAVVFNANQANGAPVEQAIQEHTALVQNQVLSTSALLQALGREAVEKIAGMMRGDQYKEETILRAARDLADRSPETSKIHKSVNLGVNVGREDMQALVAALAESKSVREQTIGAGEIVGVNQEIANETHAEVLPEWEIQTEEEKHAKRSSGE